MKDKGYGKSPSTGGRDSFSGNKKARSAPKADSFKGGKKTHNSSH